MKVPNTQVSDQKKDKMGIVADEEPLTDIEDGSIPAVADANKNVSTL